MIRMLALFKRPDDTELFDRHYDEVHSPLMRQVPGLVKMDVIRNVQTFRGEPPYYQITEMTWRDKESFDAAMASPENRAAGKDLMTFARDYVVLIYGETED